MIKDTCSGCVYEADRNKLLANQYTGWASSQPHPCTICLRFPRSQQDYPDNFYTEGELSIGTKQEYCTCDIPQTLNTCPICKKLIKQ